MIAVTGRKLSEMFEEIRRECGEIHMEERSYHFSLEKKQALRELLFTEKQLPVFTEEIDHISYLDGVKVYFKNGGWVIARFSGTEPLLRIFSEMSTADEAAAVCRLFETFLGIIQDPQ